MVSEARIADRLQMTGEHISLELRPKIIEMNEGRSMRTSEQQCQSMKTVLTVGLT